MIALLCKIFFQNFEEMENKKNFLEIIDLYLRKPNIQERQTKTLYVLFVYR